MNKIVTLVEKAETYLKAEAVMVKEWQELVKEFIAVIPDAVRYQKLRKAVDANITGVLGIYPWKDAKQMDESLDAIE
jgi:hypothetical protein